jgi:hypothetical protein
MSSGLVASASDFFTSSAILRFLVAAVLDTRDVPPDARARFIAADADEAGRPDVVAGCEFVDDRIRLRD